MQSAGRKWVGASVTIYRRSEVWATGKNAACTVTAPDITGHHQSANLHQYG
jgi:hypothetical protein